MTIFLSHYANKRLTPPPLERTITSYISPPQKHPSKSNEQLQQYVHHKATTSFVFFAGTDSPLSHTQLTTILHWLLSQTGLCPSFYTSHSFRTEAATTAAVAGLTWSIIIPLRRWNSNSYVALQLSGIAMVW